LAFALALALAFALAFALALYTGPMTGSPRRVELAALLSCLLLAGCGPSPANPKGVEQQFALATPVHSTQTQVLDYLNAQKLPHSPYHRDATNGNVIETVITIKSPRALIDPDYDVLFLFDDTGHLLKYNVDYLGYIGW
jgi:hypothetical protein